MPPLPNRHTRTAAPLLLVALALGGCGDSGGGGDAGPSDADRPDIGPPPEHGLQLGSGTSGFGPLPEEGGTLEIYTGSQGGFHVFVAVRFSDDLEPDNALLTYGLTDAADGESLILPKEVLLAERRLVREPGAWIRPRDRLIFETTEPADVAGTECEITATLETEGGETVSDSRIVTVVDEE